MSFLDPEQLIKDRLETIVATNIKVFSAIDLAGVEESSQYTPAIHVMYQNYDPIDKVVGGKTKITQTWLTIVAVRAVDTQLTGETARSEASPIIDAILSGLINYRLNNEFSELELVPIRPGQFFRSGFGYYPLAFTTETYVKGYCHAM